jgi:hypothetical protein
VISLTVTMNHDAVVKELRALFSRAPQRLDVFDYLWPERSDGERQGRTVSADELWTNVLEKQSTSNQKRGESDRDDNSSNARQVCNSLRDDLEKFFTPETRWRYQLHIELPKASARVPYQLKVYELKDTPTMAFWRPHMSGNTIDLVYAQPMFFIDIKTGSHWRFLNTNPKEQKKAFAELAEQHADELIKLYGSIEAARERLRATHAYLGMGDVAALHAIATWFYQWPWMKAERTADSHTHSLKGKSPVLIGSERTNRHISGNLDAAHCAYRLDDNELFHVRIDDPTQQERAALSNLFPSSPPREEDRGIVAGSGMTLSVKRTRLALLTRLPNPESKGNVVTAITSDTTLALQQVAHAITNDDELRPMLESFGWPESPLPPSFEMLFSVDIAPGGVDDNASPAQLLAPPRVCPTR